MGRRDFVRLMGGLGALAVLTSYNALKSIIGDAGEADSPLPVASNAMPQATATPQVLAKVSAGSSSATSARARATAAPQAVAATSTPAGSTSTTAGRPRATATPPAVAATSTPARTAASTQAKAATTSSPASSVCRVRCNRRCAYPGRCRKYVDSNKNGKCDLGECVA